MSRRGKPKKAPAVARAVDKRERQPSLAERLDAERGKVFKGMAIVDIVRVACHAVGVERDPELVTFALQAAYDLLDDAASGMEAIRDEHDDGDVALRAVRP